MRTTGSKSRRPKRWRTGDQGVTKAQSGPPRYPSYDFDKDEPFIVLDVVNAGRGLEVIFLDDYTIGRVPQSFARKQRSN